MSYVIISHLQLHAAVFSQLLQTQALAPHFIPGGLLVCFSIALVLPRREERGDGDYRQADD